MNKEDLRTFDRLIDMTDSPNQLVRIKGRLEYHHWSKKFTEDELDAAWLLIQDKDKHRKHK